MPRNTESSVNTSELEKEFSTLASEVKTREELVQFLEKLSPYVIGEANLNEYNHIISSTKKYDLNNINNLIQRYIEITDWEDPVKKTLRDLINQALDSFEKTRIANDVNSGIKTKSINKVAEKWKSKIGNYEIEYKEETLTTDAVKNKVVNLLGDNRRRLQAGAVVTTESSSKDRKAFYDFLAAKIDALPKGEENKFDTISIERFLGKDGIKLYKAAIAEEAKSQEFRDAVFLQSTKHFDGPKWDKRNIAFLGGASSTGKSYADDEVSKYIAIKMPKEADSLKAALILELEKLDRKDESKESLITSLIEQIDRIDISKEITEIENTFDRILKDLEKPSDDDQLKKMLSFKVKTTKNKMLTSLRAGNDKVSIDGGIERNISQVRNVLNELSFRDFKGIDDLHGNTKLGVKKYVRRAALRTPNLNITIPETFTVDLSKGFINTIAFIKKLLKDPNNVITFCMIKGEKLKGEEESHLVQSGPPGQTNSGIKRKEDRLQTSTRFMGNDRAWLKEKDREKYSDPENINPNNRKDKPEGKRYESEYFKPGIKASMVALNIYKILVPNPIYLSVTNDMIHLRKVSDEPGKWIECRKGDTYDLKMTNRDFKIWNEYYHNSSSKDTLDERSPKKEDLDVWYENQKTSETLSGCKIEDKSQSLRNTSKKGATFIGRTSALIRNLNPSKKRKRVRRVQSASARLETVSPPSSQLNVKSENLIHKASLNITPPDQNKIKEKNVSTLKTEVAEKLRTLFVKETTHKEFNVELQKLKLLIQERDLIPSPSVGKETWLINIDEQEKKDFKKIGELLVKLADVKKELNQKEKRVMYSTIISMLNLSNKEKKRVKQELSSQEGHSIETKGKSMLFSFMNLLSSTKNTKLSNSAKTPKSPSGKKKPI